MEKNKRLIVSINWIKKNIVLKTKCAFETMEINVKFLINILNSTEFYIKHIKFIYFKAKIGAVASLYMLVIILFYHKNCVQIICLKHLPHEY